MIHATVIAAEKGEQTDRKCITGLSVLNERWKGDTEIDTVDRKTSHFDSLFIRLPVHKRQNNGKVAHKHHLGFPRGVISQVETFKNKMIKLRCEAAPLGLLVAK